VGEILGACQARFFELLILISGNLVHIEVVGLSFLFFRR
jgi:hypothetical protein